MIISKAEYLISNADVEKCPKADRPEFAFIGRSNVGKSSLINMLVQKHGLAKTSATPGKTQLINHFVIESRITEKKPKQNWYLVDLPGYGYAKVAQKERAKWQTMIDNYLTKRKNLSAVFVLVDSRHTPQPIDLEFVHYLGTQGISFCLVFTKTDKNKPMATTRNVRAFLDKMLETWQFLPQSFTTSATTKQGRDEITAFIQNVITNFYEKPTTANT
ncbi:MAG: YihA family ribosome biogenesis GTP-binding protein [Bacteroidetes bacterium]|nr:MAG: YihA family ribosome biogenesis GTP-binding protein [Bacteroidota bacterium]TAE69632.1 MAG: YihA family ribosome biogenesis GTP-binding protein [Bacteroidota bacterium]TAF94157.1 MAG: YihA family ribosome biogenesis GTP-binding protein [Bacteroidota bacterium]